MLGFSMHWIYAHLIGDYILQNDWIAKGKKKRHLVCLLHIVLYMIPFLFTVLNPLQLVLIAAQHYIQDKWNIIGWFCDKLGKFQDPSIRFWGLVITDNVVHILWMAFVSYYIV